MGKLNLADAVCQIQLYCNFDDIYFTFSSSNFLMLFYFST